MKEQPESKSSALDLWTLALDCSNVIVREAISCVSSMFSAVSEPVNDLPINIIP